MKDYYKILELNRNATQAEIISNYRKLAIKFHPDKNGGSKSSEEKFKDVSEAYEVLSNEQKKSNYDYNTKPQPNTSHKTNKPQPKTSLDNFIQNIVSRVIGIIIMAIFFYLISLFASNDNNNSQENKIEIEQQKSEMNERTDSVFRPKTGEINF